MSDQVLKDVRKAYDYRQDQSGRGVIALKCQQHESLKKKTWTTLHIKNLYSLRHASWEIAALSRENAEGYDSASSLSRRPNSRISATMPLVVWCALVFRSSLLSAFVGSVRVAKALTQKKSSMMCFELPRDRSQWPKQAAQIAWAAATGRFWECGWRGSAVWHVVWCQPPTHISSLPQPSRGEFRKALGKGGCRCFPHYGSSRQWAIPTGSACCNIHHVTLGIPRHLENPTHGPNLEVGYLGHHGEFGVANFC